MERSATPAATAADDEEEDAVETLSRKKMDREKIMENEVDKVGEGLTTVVHPLFAPTEHPHPHHPHTLVMKPCYHLNISAVQHKQSGVLGALRAEKTPHSVVGQQQNLKRR